MRKTIRLLYRIPLIPILFAFVYRILNEAFFPLFFYHVPLIPVIANLLPMNLGYSYSWLILTAYVLYDFSAVFAGIPKKPKRFFTALFSVVSFLDSVVMIFLVLFTNVMSDLKGIGVTYCASTLLLFCGIEIVFSICTNIWFWEALERQSKNKHLTGDCSE